MVNVARVVKSSRLGAQKIRVLRTMSMWVDGRYQVNGFRDMVCPAPAEMENEYPVYSTPEPKTLIGSDTIYGMTLGQANEMSCVAIVTVANPKDLQLVPEGERITGGMKFLTTFRLHQTDAEQVSDIVVWRGAKYKIITVSPDIDYGFYRSIGVRMEGDGIG